MTAQPDVADMAAQAEAIEIEVRPIGRGRFEAIETAIGRVLGAFLTPLCTSARVLLAEGILPGTRIHMRHSGSNVVALRSTVGAAAALTVLEGAHGAPRFGKWKPFEAEIEP